MHKLLQWAIGGGLAFTVVVSTGCDLTPNRAVRGEVTLDGTPIASGRISLVPAGSGSTGGARIENGEYRIGPEKGPLPGKYLVRISSLQPTGRQIKDSDSATGTIDEMREAVPSQYNERTGLSIEVTDDGENQFDFALESAAK